MSQWQWKWNYQIFSRIIRLVSFPVECNAMSATNSKYYKTARNTQVLWMTWIVKQKQNKKQNKHLNFIFIQLSFLYVLEILSYFSTFPLSPFRTFHPWKHIFFLEIFHHNCLQNSSSSSILSRSRMLHLGLRWFILSRMRIMRAQM